MMMQHGIYRIWLFDGGGIEVGMLAIFGCPPKICLWTQGDTFHIRWDNREVLDDGLLVWDATFGEITMPVTAFIEEVKSFHERLISAMAERVDAVLSGKLRPDIHIDLVHLAQEQIDRSTWLENALTAIREKVDWDKVREALAQWSRCAIITALRAHSSTVRAAGLTG